MKKKARIEWFGYIVTSLIHLLLYLNVWFRCIAELHCVRNIVIWFGLCWFELKRLHLCIAELNPLCFFVFHWVQTPECKHLRVNTCECVWEEKKSENSEWLQDCISVTLLVYLLVYCILLICLSFLILSTLAIGFFWLSLRDY